MLTLFVGYGSAILVRFTPKGETVNSEISVCLTQWKKFWEEEGFRPIKKSLVRCKIG